MSNFYDNVFPKDLTMTMESNFIQGEVTQFSDPVDRIFVPNGGPFYAESLVLKDNNGNLLRPELDYKLLYLNETATVESGRDVVTVIWVLVDTIVATVMDYRVVGGEFGNTVYGILQELNNSGPITKNVDWHTNVFNKPTHFPAAPHYHTPETFTDWEMVYTQLEGIRIAIQGGDLPAWQAHYNYLRNLLRNLEQNLQSEFSKYPSREDVYTKDQIDEMLRKLREECCNGDSGGGPTEGGEYNLTGKREGDYIIYTVTSDNPNDNSTAPWLVVEEDAGREEFSISSRIEADDIIYTIRSNDPTSSSSATYGINEISTASAVIPPPETFTISSVKDGNVVQFTITSNITTSTTTVNLGVREYRPGPPQANISHTYHNLKLSSGKSIFRYPIVQPTPVEVQEVEGVLTATPTVKTKTIIPGTGVVVPQAALFIGSNNLTQNMPRTGTVTVNMYWRNITDPIPGWGTNRSSVGLYYGSPGNWISIQREEWMLTLGNGSKTFTFPYSIPANVGKTQIMLACAAPVGVGKGPDVLGVVN